jgi:hypothetical protein
MSSDVRVVNASSFDDEARAELLCHVVVSQLIARAKTGEWMRTDHLVETMKLWASANGASPEWLDSVRLGDVSQKLAQTVWTIELLRDTDELSKLFTDGRRLDYRSPIVRGIHDVCAERLLTWRFEGEPRE